MTRPFMPSVILQRMVDQTNALAMLNCENTADTCYGCAPCYARETKRMMSGAPQAPAEKEPAR